MLNVKVVIEGGCCRDVFVWDEHDQPVDFVLEIEDLDVEDEEKEELPDDGPPGTASKRDPLGDVFYLPEGDKS